MDATFVYKKKLKKLLFHFIIKPSSSCMSLSVGETFYQRFIPISLVCFLYDLPSSLSLSPSPFAMTSKYAEAKAE